jgi:hypothetical protein
MIRVILVFAMTCMGWESVSGQSCVPEVANFWTVFDKEDACSVPQERLENIGRGYADVLVKFCSYARADVTANFSAIMSVVRERQTATCDKKKSPLSQQEAYVWVVRWGSGCPNPSDPAVLAKIASAKSSVTRQSYDKEMTELVARQFLRQDGSRRWARSTGDFSEFFSCVAPVLMGAVRSGATSQQGRSEK